VTSNGRFVRSIMVRGEGQRNKRHQLDCCAY
jgi:hypothetical protein